MGKCVFVVASGADLPASLAADLGITVVPLTVRFGEEAFLDGINISTDQFYARLAQGGLPKTAQPSPGAFAEAYSRGSEPGDVVFSLHLSADLSGTYQAASLAAREFADRTIHVIDTRLASFGYGILAVRAARRAALGASPEEVLRTIQSEMARMRVLFLVESLDWLQRNGRIGRAQAWAGGLLNVKPLLRLENGVVVPQERVRGHAKAVARLVDIVEAEAARPLLGAVIHADAFESATALTTQLRARMPVTELPTVTLGPTIGTHVGPGALGVVFFGSS